MRGVLLFLLLSGCATALTLREINGYILRNEFAPAAQKVEQNKSSYGNKNRLLYELDRGMLLHGAGDYAASNKEFETAKQTVLDLTAKSVSAHLSTFLVNDMMTPYYGEDFERALIHVFSALNYAALGQGSEALVECRQLDSFFRALPFDGQRNAYQDDALARTLAGWLYEEEGEWNDAYVSYMKALEAYDAYAKHYNTPRPPGLVEDAFRAAQRLKFTDKAEDILRRWGPLSPAPARPDDSGEVIVLFYAGLGPEKVDSFFEISVFNGWPYVEQVSSRSQDDASVDQARSVMRSLGADKMFRVAFPKYHRQPSRVSGAEVSSDGVTTRAALMEDIGSIAVKNLEDRLARTRARAIARATVKYLLAQKASEALKKDGREGLGLIVRSLLQAAASVTEVADKRSWRTLPDKIYAARLTLPAGIHPLTLNLTDTDGHTVQSKEVPEVKVSPGRKSFILVWTAV